MNTILMITTMHFKYGFVYKNIIFGWHKKKLYRLPYIKDRRSYSLKEIPSYVFKSTVVFNVLREKKTINKLKLLTEEINKNINVISEDECPF